MDRLLMRCALAIGIAAVAAILLFSATVFLGAALYLWLATQLAPPAAAALTGLAALIAAIAVLLAGRFILGQAPTPKALPEVPAARDDAQLAQALSALVGEEFGRAFQDHPKGAAAASLAAGLAVGISPRLRAILLGLLDGAR